MIALIDGDIIVYECASVCEYKSFEELSSLLTTRIEDVQKAVHSDEPPLIYLTGSNNFRFSIANLRPYKGNRKKKERPFHYTNARNYLMGQWGAIVVDGMEADDALCIEQTKRNGESVICTRDKDLRQCNGWQYGWEGFRQGEYRLRKVEGFGDISLTEKGKLVGVGEKWFWCQVLMGDSTDDIPGLHGFGPRKTFALLEHASSRDEAYGLVSEQYKLVFGEGWEVQLKEQIDLVWMIRELSDGKPVIFDGSVLDVNVKMRGVGYEVF